MPIREFRDSEGVLWRVWDTTPWVGAVYDDRLKGGWLTFESAAGRKRLAPIPPAWDQALDERLELMCRAADVVRPRTASAADVSETPADFPGAAPRPDAPEGK